MTEKFGEVFLAKALTCLEGIAYDPPPTSFYFFSGFTMYPWICAQRETKGSKLNQFSI